MLFRRRKKSCCSDCLYYAQRVKLEPGDRIVVHVPGHLTSDQARRIGEGIKAWAPDHSIAILDEGKTLTVVATGPPSPPPTDPGKPSA